MNLKIEIVKRLTLDPEAIREGVRAALTEAAALLEPKIKQQAPVGVGGQSGLRGSIFSELRESGSLITSVTSSSLPYAVPVEFGRRAGQTPPPYRALLPWVRLKLDATEETETGIAIAVAKSIGARGTRAWRQSPPGVRMFEKGLDKAVNGIREAFKRHLGAWATRVFRS